ncbi:uncharacterized protein METZ01_LOCUS301164, partial [marine metagenome]
MVCLPICLLNKSGSKNSLFPRNNTNFYQIIQVSRYQVLRHRPKFRADGMTDVGYRQQA